MRIDNRHPRFFHPGFMAFQVFGGSFCSFFEVLPWIGSKGRYSISVIAIDEFGNISWSESSLPAVRFGSPIKKGAFSFSGSVQLQLAPRSHGSQTEQSVHRYQHECNDTSNTNCPVFQCQNHKSQAFLHLLPGIKIFHDSSTMH